MDFHKLFSAVAIAIGLSIATGFCADVEAARAWQSLTNFTLSSPPAAWTTNPPTPTDINAFDDQRATESSGFADRARNFYTQFSRDTNALGARILEASALQAAIHFGATNRTPDFVACERALVRDTNAPASLRYAWRLDLVGRDLKAAVEQGADTNVELERAGRTMIQEFPDGPIGYDLVLQVASSADLIKMHELGQFMANSRGPAALTDKGKHLLNQLKVVGQPSPVEFIADDGRPINGKTLTNRVVLVTFWATWNPLSVAMTAQVKKLYDQYHAGGFEVVGINFDSNTNQAQQFIKEQGLPWPEYFGGENPANRFERDYGDALPYAWLVDKKGIVRDIHGRKDTEAKIQKLLAEQ